MKKITHALILLVLLLLPVRSAYAWNGNLDGRVVVGQSFVLKSGETLDGDLVMIGGEAAIENNAIVKGNVVIIGGSLTLDGQVTGDVVVVGGLADLGEKSQLSGDMITVGGSLQRAEGAQIGCNVVTNFPAPTIQIPNSTNPVTIPKPPQIDFHVSPFTKAFGILLQAIVISILAMTLVLFLQPQLDRVAHTIIAQPFVAGTIGLLTVLFSPIALIILTITLILIPVALAGAFLLVLAWLFGVIAIGIELGNRFTKAIHQNWAPVLSAGFGTFALTIIVGALNTVPCVGWLSGVIIGLVGMGAVVMTMFGTRPASGPAMIAPSAPTAASGGPIPPAS
ncbi:MAG: hypothetical protein HYR70_10270 [Chloroflexi bacterium]|nr:hypothetical protein [Chloroflexota bacterium]